MSPDQALIISRFAVDACALLLWGAHGFLWVGTAPHLAAKLQKRLGTTFSLTVALLLLAALVKIPLQTAILGTGWADSVNWSLMADLLTTTRSGLALAIQVAIALILAIVYGLWPNRRLASMTFCAGLTLATLSISGHAAMNSGAMGLLHQINDSLHLLAVGAWVGALAPVLLLLSPAKNDDPIASTQSLMHFSTLGHAAVLITLITGFLNSRWVIGTVWLDMNLPYQRLLLLKIAVVTVMIALACINRYVFVPRISQDREQGLHLLRLGTAAEIGLSLLAMGLVAIFGMMEPLSP